MYAFAGYLLAAKSGGANAGLGQGYELKLLLVVPLVVFLLQVVLVQSVEY